MALGVDVRWRSAGEGGTLKRVHHPAQCGGQDTEHCADGEPQGGVDRGECHREEEGAEAGDRTGIEMEALTSVTVAALTLVDMVKGVDKLVTIRECYVMEKNGGRSGTWTRPDNA